MKRFYILALFLALTFALAAGLFFLPEKRYVLISVIAALFSCLPFFVHFEKKRISEREIVTVSVMIALGVASRFLFSVLPHFKPVTAIVIITGMYFGADAGFVTGAFTAFLSNFYYGQGIWTPFQMAGWGLTGFAAGLINKKGFLEKKSVLIVFSLISGVFYSLFMDIATPLEMSEGFNLKIYFTYVLAAIPVTITYAVSNVIFMLILRVPLGKKLKRLKTKYGIFEKEGS